MVKGEMRMEFENKRYNELDCSSSHLNERVMLVLANSFGNETHVHGLLKCHQWTRFIPC